MNLDYTSGICFSLALGQFHTRFYEHAHRPRLEKLSCLELSRGVTVPSRPPTGVLNHFWIEVVRHVAVSEVKRFKFMAVTCNHHSPPDTSARSGAAATVFIAVCDGRGRRPKPAALFLVLNGLRAAAPACDSC